jgi:hypothetical protein
MTAIATIAKRYDAMYYLRRFQGSAFQPLLQPDAFWLLARLWTCP